MTAITKGFWQMRQLFCAGVLATMLTACASSGPSRPASAGDPLQPVNRGIYKFNDVADTYVLRPVAKGYEWLLPSFMRTGINNFFENLGTPVDVVNNLLQGKVRAGLSDAARMALNTTAGLGGILDPATDAGLAKHDEDFGQTLGVWGLPEGPYLVIPFFGPRTVLSGAGQLVDLTYHPQLQISPAGLRSKINVLWIVHQRSRLLGIDKELDRAFDEYAFVRDAYLQNRLYLLYDGNPPLDESEFDDNFDAEFSDSPDEQK